MHCDRCDTAHHSFQLLSTQAQPRVLGHPIHGFEFWTRTQSQLKLVYWEILFTGFRSRLRHNLDSDSDTISTWQTRVHPTSLEQDIAHVGFCSSSLSRQCEHFGAADSESTPLWRRPPLELPHPCFRLNTVLSPSWVRSFNQICLYIRLTSSLPHLKHESPASWSWLPSWSPFCEPTASYWPLHRPSLHHPGRFPTLYTPPHIWMESRWTPKIRTDSGWNLAFTWAQCFQSKILYTRTVHGKSSFNNKPSVLNTFLTDCTEQNTSNLKYYTLRLSMEIPDGVWMESGAMSCITQLYSKYHYKWISFS
jgi:hypothetical protein